jgi:hypothetical protein
LYTLSSSIDARVIGVCLGARWYLIGMVPRLHFLVPDAYLLYTHCGYVLYAFINTTSSTRIFNRGITRNRAPDSKSHMVLSQGSCGQQRMGIRDDGTFSSPATNTHRLLCLALVPTFRSPFPGITPAGRRTRAFQLTSFYYMDISAASSFLLLRVLHCITLYPFIMYYYSLQQFITFGIFSFTWTLYNCTREWGVTYVHYLPVPVSASQNTYGTCYILP